MLDLIAAENFECLPRNLDDSGSGNVDTIGCIHYIKHEFMMNRFHIKY